MTTGAPTPDDVLAAVDALGPPGTPVTTPEVAAGFDCTKRTIYNRLDSLTDDGVLQTKKVGANSRVWWRPAQDGREQREHTPNGGDPIRAEGRPGWEPTAPADSEMAERIREFEWAETPLGPMAEWPQELRTAVDVMLGAAEAIGIYWGDDLVLLYNDAWRELIGNKHPAALGEPAQDVFPEIWDAIGPMFVDVLAGEGAAIDRERRLPLERNGQTEDAWFDYSANPIPTDDGSVGGVFNVAVEVTDRVLAERDAWETTERLEVALDAAGMGTWEWDLDERTVRGDEQMLSLFDLPPTDEPVPVERFLEKESEAGARQAEDAMATSFEPGEEIQDEFHLENADPPRWITWRGRASTDDPSVLHGVSFEITERKQAEIERERAVAALRENEARYHSLFEEMDEGFALCELVRDDGGRVHDIRLAELNDAFEELTGVSRADAEGRLASEVFPGQIDTFLETYERVVETGDPERVENYIPANDRWYEVRVFHREGDTVAVLYDDITERKEEELHREERYRTLFESINEGFCLVEVLFDEDGEQEDYRFLATNPAFEGITGLTDVAGKRRLELESGYDPQFFPLYGEVARTGEAKRFQASGEPLIEGWYDVRAFPYGEADSNQVALLIDDITERKEAERQLRESEATLSAILAQLPLGVGVLNADGVYEMQNDRMTEFLDGDRLPSRDPEKQVEWHATDDAGDPLPPEQWPGARALRGESVTPGIEFWLERDGETRWFNVAGVPFDGPSEEQKAIGIVQEITERKAAQEAIRESEERLDAFVTATSDIVYHMSPDWSEMNYLDGREFVVDTDEPRKTWVEEYIPDDERERVMAAIEEAIETESTYELEHQVLTVDGDRGWVHSRAIPVLDDDGDIVEWFGTAADITERKEMEQALRQSQKRLQAATDAAEIGVWEMDMETDEGLYISERYAEILGYDEVPDDWDLDRALDHYHPEDRERLLAYLDDGVGDATFESRIVRTDGEERWILVDSETYGGRDGAPARAVGTIQDITERREREERQQFMRDLDDALRPLADPTEVKQTAARLVGEHLGLDRAGYAELNPDGDTMTVERDWSRADVQSMTGDFDSAEFGTIFTGLYDGETTTVADSRSEVEMSEETYERTWGAIDTRAAVAAPVLKQERFVAAFYVHSADPRQWSDAELSIIEHVAERTWEAVERARAEQRLSASNQALERLNDVSRELIDADPETIRDRAAELTVDILGVEYAALWQYDGETGEIEPFSEHADPEADLDSTRLSALSRERVWETFVDDEITLENAPDIAADDGWPSELESRVFVPLGRHGVIVAGAVHAQTFGERLVDLVTMVGQTVETVWDRADSEQELALRNEELTRLDRLNTLIREIDQALVAADTRAEIDEAVCGRLADSDLYEFAWIGEHDPGTGLVEPRAWAGVDSGYLEELSITVDDGPTTRDPIARAIRTGELQVVADIATDSGFASWREATLERGARSVVCIPLVYDDTVYGVLTVYADRPQSEADDRNQDVLSELGSTIAHTINARETRATLQTDSVVELTLRFEACDTPLCRFAQEVDCQIEYYGFVPRSSGHADLFFVARDIDPTALQTAADDFLAFEDVDCLTERADGSLFRVRVSDPTLAARLTDAGAVVRSITIDGAVATAVVDIPHTTAVRAFLDQLRQRNTDFELRARQSRERPLKTRQTFVAALEDHLTDRQREVLQTAYLSGFFEVPRVSTGQEVTELLGVSQPTFSEHLREAQRRLCAVLFEDVSSAVPVDSDAER